VDPLTDLNHGRIAHGKSDKMTKPSPFFARIKGDVLLILSAVPRGRLVTFKQIGAHLDVMPRHVAYILAQLDPIEAATVPWFRAVPESGVLTTAKVAADGATQKSCLAEEGHVISEDGHIENFARQLVEVGKLRHGVPVQKRPEAAPKAASGPKRRR
jgi:methylated-DNA-protein-cysteine methyltransferase-like protein